MGRLNSNIPTWEESKPIVDTEKEIPKWEESEPIEETSPLKAGAIGAASGATLGLSDELVGAVKAAGDVMTEQYDLDDFMERWEKHQDEAEEAIVKAKKESPAAFTVGETAAGLTSLAGLGRMGAKAAWHLYKKTPTGKALNQVKKILTDLIKTKKGKEVTKAKETLSNIKKTEKNIVRGKVELEPPKSSPKIKLKDKIKRREDTNKIFKMLDPFKVRKK